MSASQVSGRKKGKKVKGAHFSGGATSLKEYSKNFCNIKLVVTNRSYKVGKGGGRKCQVGCISFPDERWVYTKEGEQRARAHNSEVRRQ